MKLHKIIDSPSHHHINTELIAIVKPFKAAWQLTFHQAARHLQGSARVAIRSSLKAVQRFAKRIMRDADYIAHVIELKLSNAAIEGFNRKIADLLKRGYGYKDLEYLSLKIRQLSIPHLALVNLGTKTF